MSAKTDSSRPLTRRHILRGAGVALALPWLESLAPRRARGQTSAPRIRFVPIYFPMGTASFWTPQGTGVGDAWQLSPILQPLLPVKSQVTVLSHVDNTAYGAANFVPLYNTYPRETSSFLTCVPAHGMPPQNGISVDQVIANGITGAPPPLRSLQLGLSPLASYSADLPAGFSRSISWSSATTPLSRQIDPQSIFNLLVSASPGGLAVSDPAFIERKTAQTSVLDFVLGDAASVQTRLGRTDRLRLEQFMTSVRDLEQRVQAVPPPAGCGTLQVPWPTVDTSSEHDAHANVMIDLMVMALACDVTRVISLMLDDARSGYVYDFLPLRAFNEAGSMPNPGVVGGGTNDYREVSSDVGLTNDYATTNWWFVSKLAALCGKLAALPEDDGRSVLDNSVVWFGSGVDNGQDLSFFNLPLLYVGDGGGVLKVGAHLDFASDRRLSDVYLTFMQKVFGLADASFADSQGIVPEILA
jgi:uncharacterized protein DUF1552